MSIVNDIRSGFFPLPPCPVAFAPAAKLGVSRGPIREKCRGLELGGLVEVIVNRGVFVRTLTDRAAAELYDIRAALMRLVGITLAPAVQDWHLAELHGLIAKMDAAARAEDLYTYYPLNLQFHRLICDYGGNERLLTLAAVLQRQAHLFRRRALHVPGRMAASNEEHRGIVAALAAGDGLLARARMEAHVMNSRVALFGSGHGSRPTQWPSFATIPP